MDWAGKGRVLVYERAGGRVSELAFERKAAAELERRLGSLLAGDGPRDRRPVAGRDRPRAPLLDPVPALGGRAVRGRPRPVDGRLAGRRALLVRRRSQARTRTSSPHVDGRRFRRLNESRWAALGGMKQSRFTYWDRLVLEKTVGWDGRTPVLHPAYMFRFLRRFWKGGLSLAHVARPPPLPPARATAARRRPAGCAPGRLRRRRFLLPPLVRGHARAPGARSRPGRRSRRGDAGRPARHRDPGRRARRGCGRALRPCPDAACRRPACREPRPADRGRRPRPRLDRDLRRPEPTSHRPTASPASPSPPERDEFLPSYVDLLRRLTATTEAPYTCWRPPTCPDLARASRRPRARPRRERADRLRILLLLTHGGYTRVYAPVIRMLAERGHTVHVAFCRPTASPTGLRSSGRLAGEHPSVTLRRRAAAAAARRLGHGRVAGPRPRRPRPVRRSALRAGAGAPRPHGREGREATCRLGRLRPTHPPTGAPGRAPPGRGRIDAARSERAIAPRRRVSSARSRPADGCGPSSRAPDARRRARLAGRRPRLGPGRVPEGGAPPRRPDRHLRRELGQPDRQGPPALRPRAAFWSGTRPSAGRRSRNCTASLAERVVATGAPRFDEWFRRRPSTTAEEFATTASESTPAGRIVLYVCSSSFVSPDEVGFVRRWVEAVRASDDPGLRELGIVVRPYPKHAAPMAGRRLVGTRQRPHLADGGGRAGRGGGAGRLLRLARAQRSGRRREHERDDRGCDRRQARPTR